MFLTIGFIAICENALAAIEPIIIIPTGIMTFSFLFALCCLKSITARNCVWITYLIVSLV